MSEIIKLIHSENNPRRFQKTRENSTPKQRARSRQVVPAGPTFLLDCIYAVYSSQFDPRAQD